MTDPDVRERFGEQHSKHHNLICLETRTGVTEYLYNPMSVMIDDDPAKTTGGLEQR